MNKLYWKNPDLALLFLRLAFGLLMMVHGWSKLQGFSEMSGSFPDPIGVGSAVSLSLAIFAEFFCSILLILGFLTPLATIPLIITMLVAAFIAHADDPWSTKEKAVLFLAAYITLLVSGPGRYSLDHKLFGPDSSGSTSPTT